MRLIMICARSQKLKSAASSNCAVLALLIALLVGEERTFASRYPRAAPAPYLSPVIVCFFAGADNVSWHPPASSTLTR